MKKAEIKKIKLSEVDLKNIKIKTILGLYLNYKEIINYLIFGILTTVVSLAAKYSLLFTILDAADAFELQVAVVISWVVACLFAYITNRIWVFESKSKKIIKEMINFFTARLVTLGMEMLIMFVFVTILELNSNTWVIVWTLVSQVAIIIGNYILSKLIVFRKK